MTTNLRAFIHFATADFRERRRQYGFFIMMMLTLYLGYLIFSSDTIIMLGRYRGIHNAAWFGNLTALTINVFLGLGGFYLIKNSIHRDLQTGVWQIIAASPSNRFTYLFGKGFSHFLVLSTIVLVLFLASLVWMTFFREVPEFEFLALLTPFLLITLPMLILIAGVTILFEVIPWLRGGLGNIIYFFLFMVSWPFSMDFFESRGWVNDALGIQHISQTMIRAAKTAFPEYSGGFSFLGEKQVFEGVFLYNGIEWTLQSAAMRLIWVLFGLLLIFIAALLFNRFEVKPQKKQNKKAAISTSTTKINTILPILTALPQRRSVFSFFRVLSGEVKLLLKTYPWWLYLILAGLNIAAIFTPTEITNRFLLPFAWGFPLLIWSKMGCQELEHNTGSLIFSAPNLMTQQWAASLTAGIGLTALFGSGACIHFMTTGNISALVAWGTTVLFIPALALFLGTISGTARAFEIIYALIWYMGPIQTLPVLDYMGTLQPITLTNLTPVYLGIAIFLLLAAFFIRLIRLRTY